MVALPSKLAQALRFTWYMIPEGWLRMAKKALLKLIDQKKVEERREAWEDKLYLQNLEILPLESRAAFLPWLQDFQSVRRTLAAAALPDWRSTLLIQPKRA